MKFAFLRRWPSLPRTLALAVPLAVAASNASAIASMPTSGTCGYIGTMEYPFAYMYGSDPGPDWGLNMIATLNFDRGTIAGNVVLITPNLNASTQRQVAFSGTFTVAGGPIPGSHLLVATVAVGTANSTTTTFSWNVMSVSRGTTLLMQQTPAQVQGSTDGGMVGQCQF